MAIKVYGTTQCPDTRACLAAFEAKGTPVEFKNIEQLENLKEFLVIRDREPIYDPEDLGVYVEAPVDADAAITIHGDSMIPTYLEGDVVYIKCCPDVHDGAVAVVFLDDDATIKHVYHESDGLLLLSDNPNYAPIRATVDDYPNLRVFGVPVGYTRIYKSSIEGKIKKGIKRPDR